MSRIYVAVDLETTGLHADRDAIIEIGAVKFRVGAEAENTTLASWSTLVNPGRPIPYRTSRLTGISQREVERAPRLRAALEQLTAFVGNYPIVGHNIAFDLSFLQRHNCLVGNASLDTFELASILLPQAPRYSLAQLANHLGLDLESHHRALEDALATQQLFTRLWQIACQLPPMSSQSSTRWAPTAPGRCAPSSPRSRASRAAARTTRRRSRSLCCPWYRPR